MIYGVASGTGDQNGYAGLGDKGRAQFNRMAAAGITHIRFNSTVSSAVVDAALAAGLQPMFSVVGYDDGSSTPATWRTNVLVPLINTWLPSGITVYEILNEPNNPKNWNNTGTLTNPIKYTSFLQGAYTAAKGISSSVQVMFGSPGGYGSYGSFQASYNSSTGDCAGWINPQNWLELCYANGAHGYFDIMGQHPYSYPYPPGQTESWVGWYQMTDLATHSTRNQMVTNGDSALPIWVTEIGATTDGTNNSAPTVWPAGTQWYQAMNLDKALADAQTRSYIQAFFPFCWADSVTDGAWGLNDSSYKPKMSLALVAKYTNPAAYARWAGTAGARGRLTI